MLNRRIIANMVFFLAAFALMTWWAVNNIVSVDAIDRPYAVKARFSNAFGVLANAEVTYRGVAYGRVTGVERIPGGVEVSMDIDRGRRVPRQAGASISRKSAIGEPYIDLLPPAGYSGDGPFLEPGALIPMERTSVPLEFSELLRSAGTLVESIPEESLAVVITELADALEGRGGSLRDLTTSSGELADTFAARTAALDRLLENNTRLTAALARERGALGSSMRDLALLAESLRRSSPSTVALLDHGSVLTGHLSTLVAANKQDLVCDLQVLERVIDVATTPDRLRGLAATLDLGPQAFAGLWDARDVEADGVWVRVGTVNNSSNLPAQYVPPRSLPAVVGASTCPLPSRTSAPRASGIDYVPASRSTGSGPLDGRALGHVVVGMALAAAAVAGATRRTGPAVGHG